MKLDYEMDNDGAVNLRAGILDRAMRDYVLLLREDNPDRLEKDRMEALERFFLSPWGQWLSGNCGEGIIRHCREKARRKKK